MGAESLKSNVGSLDPMFGFLVKIPLLKDSGLGLNICDWRLGLNIRDWRLRLGLDTEDYSIVQYKLG